MDPINTTKPTKTGSNDSDNLANKDAKPDQAISLVNGKVSCQANICKTIILTNWNIYFYKINLTACK